MSVYYVPSINIMGAGSLKELGPAISDLGFKKALVVTDKFLVSCGVVEKVTNILKSENIEFVVYDEVLPNPTCEVVNNGLIELKRHECDFVVSIGGGSPQDTAKAVALLATNGGDIKSFEGVNKTNKKALPIVAVNTTAGTSSEVNPVINFLISTLYTNCSEGEYLHFKVSKNKEIQDIVESIIVELYEGDIVSKAKTKLLVGLLLVELIKSTEDMEVFSGDNYEKKMIIDILKYIDDNYKDASLIQISYILKQNDYKVSKLIKKHLNCTFKELLQDKKLTKSAELLIYTNMPITQIIEEVGYENLTYFYKIFKAKYNMTPKDYRKENKKYI